MGARVPSRTILLHPDPGARADRLDAEIEHECFPDGRPRDLRGDRPHLAARRHGEGAGERRRPAAAPRSAGVPALARQAAVRSAASSSSWSRVADRLIVDSGGVGRRPAAGLPRGWPRSSTGSPSPTSPGRGRCRWRAALAELWPGIKDARSAARHRPRGGGGCCSRGWLRSRLKRAVAVRRTRRARSARVEVDGERGPARAPAADDALGDLLSDAARGLRPRPRLRGGRPRRVTRCAPAAAYNRRARACRGPHLRVRRRASPRRRPRLPRLLHARPRASPRT